MSGLQCIRLINWKITVVIIMELESDLLRRLPCYFLFLMQGCYSMLVKLFLISIALAGKH